MNPSAMSHLAILLAHHEPIHIFLYRADRLFAVCRLGWAARRRSIAKLAYMIAAFVAPPVPAGKIVRS
jgi:hypothetical protein